jgi:hypothetical protein
MTRSRALKHAIRERAARTGERYTTARRHVIAAAQPHPPVAPPRAQPKAVDTSKSPVSDARIREQTGHGLDHWFAVLDRFGVAERGHTATARHLVKDHGVAGWYAQGITVGYERVHGLRAVNQRLDGQFEVSVSKTIAADVPTIIKTFTNLRQRKQWTADVDPDLVRALEAALKDKASKGFVVRADGLAQFRYKWDGTAVHFYLQPGKGRVMLVVQNSKLASQAALDARRAQWKAALAALARYLTAS